MESSTAVADLPTTSPFEGEASLPYEDFEKNYPSNEQEPDYNVSFVEGEDEPEKPRDSSSVGHNEEDSKPQAQTYVITDEGVFPVDKADEPAEIRDRYELIQQSAEQKKIIEEIKTSTEQQHIEVLFKTVTNDQGQTEKHYSVQTFTPDEKPDPKGRRKFVLSSELRIDIVDKEELESESDGAEQESAVAIKKQAVDSQVDPVEKNQETKADEKSQNAKQASQEPVKSEPKELEAKEVHGANTFSSPSDTPDIIPSSTAPQPDSGPEEPTPTDGPLGEPIEEADSPDTSKADTIDEQQELFTPQSLAENPADVHEDTPAISETVGTEASGETTEKQTITETSSQFTSEPMIATRNSSDTTETATEKPSLTVTSDSTEQIVSSPPVAKAQSHGLISPQETVSVEEPNKNQIIEQEVANPLVEITKQKTSKPQAEATTTNPEPVRESKAQDQRLAKRALEKPSVVLTNERTTATPAERPKETIPVTVEPLTTPSHEAPQPSSEVSSDGDLTVIIDSYSDTARNPEKTARPKVIVSFEDSLPTDKISSPAVDISAPSLFDRLQDPMGAHFTTFKFKPVTSGDLTAVFTNREPSKRKRPANLTPMTTKARA